MTAFVISQLGMVRRAWTVSALMFFVSGCTERNPDFCSDSSDCPSSRPVCDVDGRISGTSNTCVGDTSVDAGQPTDAGLSADARIADAAAPDSALPETVWAIAVANSGIDVGQIDRAYRHGETEFLTTGWSPASESSHAIAWGDFDDDGDDDLVQGTNSSIAVYRNAGGTLDLTPTWDDDVAPLDLAWADADGDGDLDIAVATGGDNVVFRNNNGTTTFSPIWTLANSGLSRSVAWADYDGDGDLDLAFANSVENHVFRNDGAVFTRVWVSPEQDDSYGVAWVFADADTAPDLVFANSGANRVYRNAGGGEFDLFWSSVETHSSRDVAVGDLDGDGLQDLMFANFSSTANTGYYNTGSGFGLEWSSNEEESSQGVAICDFDNDGDLDVAFGSAGGVRAHLSDGIEPAKVSFWMSSEGDHTRAIDIGVLVPGAQTSCRSDFGP